MIKETSAVHSCLLHSWEKNVPLLLESCSFGRIASNQELILLKPNLVEALAPPITTPVALMAAIIDYLLDYLPPEKIIIGEGCGSTSYDTYHTFEVLGYTTMASQKGVQLLDLNIEPLSKKANPNCTRWPEMYLPEILDRACLFSIPVLKAHSLADVTLTMKNMMGCAPPSHYQKGGGWAKASFHTGIHQAIFDLNRYRAPDFTLLDASIGMAQAHLWGPQCDPPVQKIAASYDPVAIDSYGASLLKRNWQDIEHISLAHGILGQADSLTIIDIE